MQTIVTNSQGIELKDGDVFKTSSAEDGHSAFIIYGVTDDYEIYYVNINMIVGGKYRSDKLELLNSGIEILYNAFEEGEKHD